MTPKAVKLIEFQTNIRERALRWFIKWSEACPIPVIDDVKKEFVKEFKLPQTGQQGLLEMWNIKQREGETAWDMMRRCKDAIGKLSYLIDLNHLRDWIIKALLPLMRTPLTQKKIDTLQDAMEQVLKIKAMMGYLREFKGGATTQDHSILGLQN